MPVRKRHGQWMVDISYTKPDNTTIRVRRISPVNSKRGAQTYEGQVRRAILDGSWSEDAVETVEEPRTTPTFKDFSEDYMEYFETRVKPGTAQNYRASLRTHLVPAFGDLPVDQIDEKAIDQFRGRTGKTLKAQSLNNVLGQLSRMLKVAQRWGHISVCPTIEKVKATRTSENDFDFLTYEECKKLLHALRADWHDITLMGIRTGMRVGELAALRWSAVDLDRKRVKVSQNYRATSGLDTTKSGRSREIPLVAELLEMLRRRKGIADSDYVFGTEEGEPFNMRAFAHHLDQAAKKAGLRHIHPHILRHTAASHAVMRGVHLAVIKKWLGHANIEHTMRYAHLADSAHSEALKLIEGTLS